MAKDREICKFCKSEQTKPVEDLRSYDKDLRYCYNCQSVYEPEGSS